MSREFDVIVVGSGVVGAAAAGLLIARRCSAPGRVALVADGAAPQQPGGVDWDLRVFALSRASQRLLRICGVWDRLPRDRVFRYERMCVWDASGSADDALALRFDCAELGEPDLGSIVEGRALHRQCLQEARAAGAVLIESAIGAVTVGDSEVSVALADGRELSSQLLVAADGPLSKTRALLGIDTAGHSYQQDAIVAHVRTEKPHQNTAWQRFLASGPLAFLPLPDGRSSIVWTTGRAAAAGLLGQSAEEFSAALTEASGGVLGRCEVTTPLASFPLQLQYAMSYVRPRAALVGDAAHVIHPMAGQGLNLGLLDCGALVDVLGDARDARSFGDLKLLRRYERWRKSENLLTAAALDGLDRLFSNKNPVLRKVRSAGLGAIGKIPLLKREFARRALGLAGDVPSFLI